MAEYHEVQLRPDYFGNWWRGLLNALICWGILWCACNAVFGSPKPAPSHLTMGGPLDAKWKPSSRTVTLSVGKIANDGDGASGDLSLEVWARDKPYSEGPLQGEPLASCDLKERLESREYYEPASYDLDVALLETFDRPKTILVALLEEKEGKETVVSFVNLRSKYAFRRDVWLRWYEKVPAWGWLGIVAASGGLIGGAVWAFRARRPRA